MLTIRHGTIAAAGLMLAACTADTTAPRAGVTDAMLTRDVASDVAATVGLDLAQMDGAELAAGMPMDRTAPPGTPLCPYSPSAGRFVCPPVQLTPDGLTLERSYALWSGNVPQAAYDAVTTDSMNFQSVLTGTLARPGRTASLHETRSLTVRGLAGAETSRIWRGIGARSDSARVTTDGPARNTTLESVDRIDDVVYGLPRAAHPFPLAGTITHDVVATAWRDGAAPNDRRSIVRHVVVTFDGTRTARLLVGATPCTLDLVTRAVSCQ